jgi:hypothetical protein
VPGREGYITFTMFVFLIGTGRCGSSLVNELLAHHPGVGFLSNVQDRLPRLPAAAGRWNQPLYARLPPALARKGGLRFGPTEGYQALAHAVSPMLVAPTRDLVAADAQPWLAARFRAFFQTRADAQGRPVFLHKFTGWPRSGFIDAVLPGARFIHVVRDGRAVTASELRAPWWIGHRGPEQWDWGPLPPAYAAEWEASGRSFVLLSGLEWKILMDAHASARSLVSEDRWLDVRFEDVLADPRGRLKEMLDFMSLEWTPGLEAAVARTAFEPDRGHDYRRQLDPASVALLDASLGGHLRRWGYE